MYKIFIIAEVSLDDFFDPQDVPETFRETRFRNIPYMYFTKSYTSWNRLSIFRLGLNLRKFSRYLRIIAFFFYPPPFFYEHKISVSRHADRWASLRSFANVITSFCGNQSSYREHTATRDGDTQNGRFSSSLRIPRRHLKARDQDKSLLEKHRSRRCSDWSWDSRCVNLKAF